MTENNGFDLSELVPAPPTAAPLSAAARQLPAELKEPFERDLLTIDNPKALLNMLPEAPRRKILSVIHNPENDELFRLMMAGDEQLLKRKVGSSRVDAVLRYGLWTEHAHSCERGDAMINQIRVYAPVCTRGTWENILESKRIFWILTPPTDIQAMNRTSYQKALERLDDILDLPLIDENGKVNAGLANLQLKIFALLDTRLNGPITHKHEINTRNVHVGVTHDQVKKLFEQSQREAQKMVENDIINHKGVIEVEAELPPHERHTDD